jgi:hypothetical protein
MKYTTFDDVRGKVLTEHETTWPAFVEMLRSLPRVPQKEMAPLASLCTYGDHVLPGGESRRNAQNVLAVYGVEVDYDGGIISPEEGKRKLQAAGVKAVVCTTARHSPNAPRWRAFLPFDAPGTLADREAALERVNGLFGARIAQESFSVSQAFYIGPAGDADYIVEETTGQTIDTATHLPRVPKKHRVRPEGTITPDTEEDWIEDILSGVGIHPAIASLAMKGWGVEQLRHLCAQSTARETRPKRYARMMQEGGEIDKAVASAGRKKAEQQQAEHDRLMRQVAEVPAPPRPVQRPKLLVPASHMVANPRRPEWLIKPFVETNLFGDVFGQPESGKSYVTLGWAFCIAAGIPWLGEYQVKQGDVVYVAGEGFTGISRRLRAMSDQLGVPTPANLYVSERAVAFNVDGPFKELTDEIDALPNNPVVIFVDTVARATPGLNMDTAIDAAVFVGKCDELRQRYGCAVITVRHSGHGNQHRAMGSIAFLGALDFEARVERIKDGPSVLSPEKMKDGEPFAPIALNFERVTWMEGGREDPFQVESMIVTKTEMPSQAANPAQTAGERLDQLAYEILEQSGGKMLTKDHRDDYIRLKGGNPETARTGHYKVLARLTEAGKIIEYAGHLYAHTHAEYRRTKPTPGKPDTSP